MNRYNKSPKRCKTISVAKMFYMLHYRNDYYISLYITITLTILDIDDGEQLYVRKKSYVNL